MASGAADMVSMVRALIADPELVNKARRGEEHLIRPCIGSNFGCVGQLMCDRPLSAAWSTWPPPRRRRSASSRSARPPVREEGPGRRRRPGRAGGGPHRGAARATRSHLHEATRRLGGQVAIAATAPHRSDIGAITEWLASEIERLGVTIRLSSMVEPDVVAEVAPDEVIVATGSSPRRDGFQLATPVTPVPGHDLPHVYTLVGRVRLRRTGRARGPGVVFDDTGTFEAISVADALLDAGAAGDHGQPLREHRRARCPTRRPPWRRRGSG